MRLPGAPITDAGLVHFVRLRSLKYLDLRRTKVTAAGIAKLRASLPRCEIVGP
jgi:hypothetical protein